MDHVRNMLNFTVGGSGEALASSGPVSAPAPAEQTSRVSPEQDSSYFKLYDYNKSMYTTCTPTINVLGYSRYATGDGCKFVPTRTSNAIGTSSCSSDHKASPKSNPSPASCTSKPDNQAAHAALTLNSSSRRPVLRTHTGAVIQVTVSYQNRPVQVPKVRGSVLCLIGSSQQSHGAIRAEYLAQHAGTATVASALKDNEGHQDSPVLLGTIVVQ